MNEPKLKSYIVTEIEFDYDDGNNMESYEVGVWFAYDDEHLIDKISDTVEFCIKSISFEPNRPHALTSYM